MASNRPANDSPTASEQSSIRLDEIYPTGLPNRLPPTGPQQGAAPVQPVQREQHNCKPLPPNILTICQVDLCLMPSRKQASRMCSTCNINCHLLCFFSYHRDHRKFENDALIMCSAALVGDVRHDLISFVTFKQYALDESCGLTKGMTKELTGNLRKGRCPKCGFCGRDCKKMTYRDDTRDWFCHKCETKVWLHAQCVFVYHLIQDVRFTHLFPPPYTPQPAQAHLFGQQRPQPRIEVPAAAAQPTGIVHQAKKLDEVRREIFCRAEKCIDRRGARTHCAQCNANFHYACFFKQHRDKGLYENNAKIICETAVVGNDTHKSISLRCLSQQKTLYCARLGLSKEDVKKWLGGEQPACGYCEEPCSNLRDVDDQKDIMCLICEPKQWVHAECFFGFHLKKDPRYAYLFPPGITIARGMIPQAPLAQQGPQAQNILQVQQLLQAPQLPQANPQAPQLPQGQHLHQAHQLPQGQNLQRAHQLPQTKHPHQAQHLLQTHQFPQAHQLHQAHQLPQGQHLHPAHQLPQTQHPHQAQHLPQAHQFPQAQQFPQAHPFPQAGHFTQIPQPPQTGHFTQIPQPPQAGHFTQIPQPPQAPMFPQPTQHGGCGAQRHERTQHRSQPYPSQFSERPGPSQHQMSSIEQPRSTQMIQQYNQVDFAFYDHGQPSDTVSMDELSSIFSVQQPAPAALGAPAAPGQTRCSECLNHFPSEDITDGRCILCRIIN